MGTIFKSALRLFTGSAKRDELAGELSDKLYSGRPGAENMGELGIEIEKAGGKPPGKAPAAIPASDRSLPAGAMIVAAQPGAQLASSPEPKAAERSEQPVSNRARDALLGRTWKKAKANPELSLVPLVLLGMFGVHLFRRRRSPEDDFVLPDLSKVLAAESEAHDMKHPLHALQAEDFELLVAMVYQRQG